MSLTLNGYHRTFLRWLSEKGVSYMEEYPVGPFFLDIYLPDLRRGVEIDGPLHNRRKDWERDKLIRDWLGIEIVRIPVGTKKAKALGIALGDSGS